MCSGVARMVRRNSVSPRRRHHLDAARRGRASRSMWSVPVVGEPMYAEVRRGGQDLGVDLVAEAHDEHLGVGHRVEQPGAVEGPVDHRADRRQGRPGVGGVVERLREDDARREGRRSTGDVDEVGGVEDVARLHRVAQGASDDRRSLGGGDARWRASWP